MSTVLLATDGSDHATAAMTRGLELLGRDHRFVALNVVPPAYVPAASVTPMDTHPTIVDPDLEREIEREDRVESSQELVALRALLEVDLDARVEIGDPGVTICAVASELDADVVVIGSHGHGWLQRVLMGSVSHHVLQHAPCPVLMVRLEDVGAPA